MSDTDTSLNEHYLEQISFREKQIEACSKIYNSTSKEIKKHQVMLDYYKRKIKSNG